MAEMNIGTICVVGCGYVGLPLADLLSNHFSVIGFDTNDSKIESLKKGHDPTNELGRISPNIKFSSDPAVISAAQVVIVAVPTPITKTKQPDLRMVKAASKIVGQNMEKGATVVYESTVYPGVTEEICLPILQKESGLKCPVEFKIGYSPERVNPGDKDHTIDKIVKIISAIDDEGLKVLEYVYGKICKAGLHKTSNIRTAEAAKVIENIQRDLNISLVNELALIFNKLGMDTREVIDAASTKWNFHRYTPGLVGGHCIGVDPYYLTYKAQELGYIPQVILAGRAVNESMPKHVVDRTIHALNRSGKPTTGSTVLIKGISFKENCNDVRNSKAKEMIKALQEYGVNVIAHDPLISKNDVQREFGIINYDWDSIPPIDALIIHSPHACFTRHSLDEIKSKFKDKVIIMDIKKSLAAKDDDIVYHSL